MGVVDRLRGWWSSRLGSNQAQTAETLERLVELTNPRLRSARRYRRQLSPAVKTAMDYAAELVVAAAPAREATADAWLSDGCLRAFFATPDDVARALSLSAWVRTWFEANGSEKEVYAVLSMLMMERTAFGVTSDGHALRRDMPQKTVSFVDHRARILARSEPELRRELERRIVEQLALASMGNATHDKARRALLEREQALLRARFHLHQSWGAGMGALGGTAAPEEAQLARIQAELAINGANLKNVDAQPAALSFQLECLREAMANPRDHFFVSAKRLRVDGMNVILSASDPAPCETLDLQLARIPMGNGPPEVRTFVLVRFPRAELIPGVGFNRVATQLLR